MDDRIAAVVEGEAGWVGICAEGFIVYGSRFLKKW